MLTSFHIPSYITLAMQGELAVAQLTSYLFISPRKFSPFGDNETIRKGRALHTHTVY